MKLARTLPLVAAWAATAAASKVQAPQGGLRAFHKLMQRTVVDDDAFDDDGFGIPRPDWYCSALCCDSTEETCYDDNSNPTSCAAIADGGCPCPEGEIKCGADPDPDNGNPGYCTTLCCANDEETCYDENYDPASATCVSIASGGCPCPDGETKCGLDAATGNPGYCAKVCCDWETEETCYDDAYNEKSCAAIADGGCPCPEGETKCGADSDNGWAGYCSTVCCGDDEEMCYDDEYNPTSCAPFSTGGCSCPAGEARCGADIANGYLGYCTVVCCGEGEETCYDENYDPASCASIANGGCPCADGEVKCGADLDAGYAGYCTDTCCEGDTPTYCFDDNDELFCAEGDCCPGEQKCTWDDGAAQTTLEFARAMKLRQPHSAHAKNVSHKDDAAKLIESKGTPKEVAYYRNLVKEREVVSNKAGGHAKSIERREQALVRSIELRAEKMEKAKSFSKNVGVSFM